MIFVSPKDLTVIQFCGLLRNLGNPCQIDGHSGAKDVAEGACSHQETLRRQVPKVSELQNQGSNYICYKMATIGFYQKHVVLKPFQISTFLKVAHSYAFIMKTLMISGLSFALCQSKRSTNMAGRKEPSRICEVYKDLLSSNADSMDGS